MTRVDEIKSALAVNLEAERKVAQLNDEIQGLVRSLKTKDQTVQESGVKIELMERRMETVKKQADTISDLEAELAKAKKQEKTYEEAMEQLQGDLDAAEQENVKLKNSSTAHDRQGMVLFPNSSLITHRSLARIQYPACGPGAYGSRQQPRDLASIGAGKQPSTDPIQRPRTYIHTTSSMHCVEPFASYDLRIHISKDKIYYARSTVYRLCASLVGVRLRLRLTRPGHLTLTTPILTARLRHRHSARSQPKRSFSTATLFNSRHPRASWTFQLSPGCARRRGRMVAKSGCPRRRCQRSRF